MEKKDLHNLIDTIKTNFDRMIHDSIKSIDNYIDKEEENKIPEPEEGMWCYFWDDDRNKFDYYSVKRQFKEIVRYDGFRYLAIDNSYWNHCELCHDQWLPAKYKGIIKEGDLFIAKGPTWTNLVYKGMKGLISLDEVHTLHSEDQFLIVHREES